MKKIDLEKRKRIQTVLDINHELFQALLVAFLILLLMEQLWTGSVSRYLDMNIFLGIVIISGAVAVLTHNEEKRHEDVNKKKWLIISAAAGVIGGIIIWYKLSQFAFGTLIAVIGAILIFLLSWFIAEEDDSPVGKKA